MDTYTQPVTAKRRHRGLEEKRRIVEETLAEGASIALVARTRHIRNTGEESSELNPLNRQPVSVLDALRLKGVVLCSWTLDRRR